VARRVASRILTLPIYPDLPEADVHRICDIIQFIRQEHRSPAERALASHPGVHRADASEVLATP
jgi:hypothetical protein